MDRFQIRKDYPAQWRAFVEKGVQESPSEFPYLDALTRDLGKRMPTPPGWWDLALICVFVKPLESWWTRIKVKETCLNDIPRVIRLPDRGSYIEVVKVLFEGSGVKGETFRASKVFAHQLESEDVCPAQAYGSSREIGPGRRLRAEPLGLDPLLAELGSFKPSPSCSDKLVDLGLSVLRSEDQCELQVDLSDSVSAKSSTPHRLEHSIWFRSVGSGSVSAENSRSQRSSGSGVLSSRVEVLEGRDILSPLSQKLPELICLNLLSTPISSELRHPISSNIESTVLKGQDGVGSVVLLVASEPFVSSSFVSASSDDSLGSLEICKLLVGSMVAKVSVEGIRQGVIEAGSVGVEGKGSSQFTASGGIGIPSSVRTSCGGKNAKVIENSAGAQTTPSVVMVSTSNLHQYSHVDRPGWKLAGNGVEMRSFGKSLAQRQHNNEILLGSGGRRIVSMMQTLFGTKLPSKLEIMEASLHNNMKLIIPKNFSIGLPGYTCGSPFKVVPAKYRADGGCRWMQALYDTVVFWGFIIAYYFSLRGGQWECAG
ncbi:hypothetical protein HHK36_030393 [Tetracentron sinense]|uniref:Uncharacterized protein n=1 Tax=Tetracentron sinense TaxID=13715 RepID=A0A835D0K8_TETSI|nr:hypothetical protein HHK36_030393 [Tetracentron sinense]